VTDLRTYCFFVFYSCVDPLPPFFLQGLILINALRAQKNAEDESCHIALSNLRSEVIKLRNEAAEKVMCHDARSSQCRINLQITSFEEAKITCCKQR
jgi:hypothetical protein